MTSARTPGLWGHKCEEEGGAAVAERIRRRYAERGVDRERLRLRIDREVANRLRAAAAAHRLSVNALAEFLLADHLAGADADRSTPNRPQTTDRERPPTNPADPSNKTNDQ